MNSKKKEFSFSRELTLISELTAKIAEALEEELISEGEADVILKHLFVNFLEKRINRLLDNTFSVDQKPVLVFGCEKDTWRILKISLREISMK